MTRRNGLTIFELLITVAILAFIAAGSFGIYRNFAFNYQLEQARVTVLADLKMARARAMSGEDAMNWGIHFVNASSSHYYELFESPTTYGVASSTVKATTFLPGTVAFTSPSTNASSVVVFTKITGTVSATQTATFAFEGTTATVTITPVGNIY